MPKPNFIRMPMNLPMSYAFATCKAFSVLLPAMNFSPRKEPAYAPRSVPMTAPNPRKSGMSKIPPIMAPIIPSQFEEEDALTFFP